MAGKPAIPHHMGSTATKIIENHLDKTISILLTYLKKSIDTQIYKRLHHTFPSPLHIPMSQRSRSQPDSPVGSKPARPQIRHAAMVPH